MSGFALVVEEKFMSVDSTFAEDVYEKYWGAYAKECKATKTHPSTSDFLIYLDENQLIPEPIDE